MTCTFKSEAISVIGFMADFKVIKLIDSSPFLTLVTFSYLTGPVNIFPSAVVFACSSISTAHLKITILPPIVS